MRYLRPMLALILVLAFSAPAIAEDVLIKRYANSEVYRVNSTTNKLVMGGDVENALPFDGGTEYVPWNLIFAEGTPMGNWTWLGKGTIGYLIKPSISTVRMYPIRGDPTKFIEIAPLAPQPSIVNQISAKSLELYVEQTYTRWSLSMTPQGFKPNILLKPGYSGDGTFQFRFELNGGLTLNGAWIMDGATRVLKMHNPFSIDAEGTQRAVSESLVDGVVTLTADLNGFVYPGIVDPTLGPIQVNMDADIASIVPTYGYGQATRLILWGNTRRILMLWDVSAIPITATVTSADMTLVRAASSGVYNVDSIIYRQTIIDWEDAGNNTNGAEANWNNYKDPNVAWPGGSGALGDADLTVSDSVAGSLLTTIPVVISLSNNIQDAITNRSGIASLLWKYVVEPGTSQQVEFASLENATAGNRPTLTVEYTVAADDILIRPWCSRKGASNEKAICALPYHIN